MEIHMVLYMIWDNLWKAGLGMLLLAFAYGANVLFSTWRNVKVLGQQYDKDRLKAGGVKLLCFGGGLVLLCVVITTIPIFSQLKPNEQGLLLRMVTKHIQYMDQSILEYVDVLYGHYDAVRNDEEHGRRGILTPTRLDEVFDLLTERVLSRSTWLANKLHQPKLGQFVRELYLDSKASRETQPRTTE